MASFFNAFPAHGVSLVRNWQTIPFTYGKMSDIFDIICFTVIPAGTIQIATQGEGVPGLHTLTMSNAATPTGAIVQYAQGQDTQFFVPGVLLHHFRKIIKKLRFVFQSYFFPLNRHVLSKEYNSMCNY